MYKEALYEFEKIASVLSSEDLEVYANEVLAELEKEASRRYKAIIGELSPESLKRLTQPQHAKVKLSRGETAVLADKNYMKKDYNIHDYRREADGLNTGSDILAKKHGIFVGNLSPKEFARRGYKAVADNPANIEIFRAARGLPKDSEVGWLRRKILQRRDKRDLIKTLEAIHRDSGGYASTTSGKKGQRVVSIGDIDRDDSLFRKNILFKGTPPPKKGTVARQYLDATFKRHEIDENIGSVAARKNKKTSVGKSDLPEERMHSTMVASHATPKVLFRESANVAGAPPEAKQYIEHLRHMTGETGFMRTLFGHSYGKSGKYDKVSARNAELYMGNLNKENLNTWLYK